MTVSSKHPVDSGGIVAGLSIIEDDSSSLFNGVNLHPVSELLDSWQHIGVLAGHVSEVSQINESGSWNVTLVIAKKSIWLIIYCAVENLEI